MLASLHDLMRTAVNRQFALGAFNTYNLEITSGIIAAAEALQAPVVLQTAPGTLLGAGGAGLSALVLALARQASVPVAVHLDHCADLELIRRMIGGGYTSVMVDGSDRPLSDNITLTRSAVAAGHAAGVAVEAELGGIPGDEDRAVATSPASFTDPENAAHFVAETGVDSLAVAIGNVHGFYRGEPKLEFDLLDELRRLPVPLVLHGASGLSDEDVRRAVSLGIRKINFNTELRSAYLRALEFSLPTATGGADVSSLMTAGSRAVQEVVEQKLRLLGANG